MGKPLCSDMTVCELASSMKTDQKPWLTVLITAPAESLNPNKLTKEQHFRINQFIIFTNLNERMMMPYRGSMTQCCPYMRQSQSD